MSNRFMDSNTTPGIAATTTQKSWPFAITREQMEMLTALATEIEEFVDDAEEIITEDCGHSLDGLAEWQAFAQASTNFQTILRSWGDYSGYEEVAP